MSGLTGGSIGRKAERVVRTEPKKKRKIKASPNQVSVKHDNSISGKPSFLQYMLTLIYKDLYILGATMIRRWRGLGRKRKISFSRIRGRFLASMHHMGVSVKHSTRTLLRKIKAPFLRVGRAYRIEQPTILARKVQGKIPVASYWEVTKQVGRLLFSIFATIFNYAAPIAAVAFLVVTVNKFVNPSVALQIKYKDEVLGYVATEQDFANAMDTVNDRIISVDGTSTIDFTERPSYELVPVDKSKVQYIGEEELSDKIILSSGGEIDWAHGVYIDDKLVGVVNNDKLVFNELDQILANNLTGRANEKRPEFLKNVRVTQKGLYPSSSIVDASVIIEKLHSDEQSDEVYIVVSGDTPSGVAEKLGVPYSQLKAMNPNIESSDFKPGFEIYSARAIPFLSVKNIFTDVYLEEIKYEVEKVENSTFAKSYSKVEVEGANGLEQVSAEVTYVNGVEVDRTVLTRIPVIEPRTEKVVVGVAQAVQPQQGSYTAPQTTTTTPKPADIATSSPGFMWPTTGGYVSCPIYGYPGHTGMDIAGNGGVGSAVYASASGTVVKAVNSYVGYGRHIIIDHGNGYQTLYAHCNELYVSVGDYVTKGQVISTSGRTGNVTGPHLHFEIRRNGSYLNPASHISR